MNLEEIKSRESFAKPVQEYANRVKQSSPNVEAAVSALGVSSRAVLHDIINAHWLKVSAAQFDRLAAQCTTQQAWRVVETNNYTLIRGAINKAAAESNLNALCGDTGTGKTTAALQLSQKMPNVFYVLADVTMTQAGFLNAILTQLTPQSHVYRGIREQTKAVCDLLKKRPNPVLLIDDAGKLRETCLSIIQVIYDRTKGSAGIVLLGTEGLWQKVAKHTNTNKFFMRELNARITWGVLNYATATDVKNICLENGITDEMAQTWLYNATYALHTLENVIATAKKVSSATAQPITEELLARINKNTLWFKPESRNFRDRLTN
jgi:type II secretory pathway predicted ATPase ExeA